MNTVERLLALDAGKIKAPEKTVRMKPAKVGMVLEFPCAAISPEKYSEIQESSYEIGRKGDFRLSHLGNMKILTVTEGCPTVFKNRDLMAKFSCPTPKELVNKLLLSGEIDTLYGEITALNGYEQGETEDESAEDSVKN